MGYGPTIVCTSPTGSGAARLARLADSTRRLGGWRRSLSAATLGAVAVLALPPLHVLPALIPAFTGFFWLVQSATGLRGAIVVGWWFGLGYFAAGLYWVAFAFLVHVERHGWMMPFAVFGLAAVQALFPAVAAAASRLLPTRSVYGRIVLFATAWTACEWLRAWAFTGFPWNLLGTVWAVSDAMLQPAAFVGVYGLSLITVIAAVVPAALAGGPRDDDADDAGPSGRSVAVAAVALAAVVLVGLWGAGTLRLAGAGAGTVEDVRLRLVQPAIPQALKWADGWRAKHVEKQLRMSVAPGGDLLAERPTHVIWPETAVPYFLANEPGLLSAIGEATPRGGLTLIGAPRATPKGVRPFKVWNSLHAVDDNGRIVGTYDKVHLVPFGEYVPMRSLLPLAKITAGVQDFSSGPGLRTMHLPGLPPVAPLICYEVIFPSRVASRDDRPAWLLNLTNDAWFGVSSGPYQHFAAARLRAVEEGVPLVRVANTGISAVVDAHGRVIARLALDREGVLDSVLPRALSTPPPYARFGDWISIAVLVVSGAIGLVIGTRPARGVSDTAAKSRTQYDGAVYGGAGSADRARRGGDGGARAYPSNTIV